ncbi:MAG: ThuA domain-containing protein [Pirellulales bacterium]|nr:ThuA domain-containing protein [Pirellulales bacterium]
MRFLLLTLISLGLAAPLIAADPPKPHVVMLIAEREYQTDQTLPAFAKQYLERDYRTTFVRADAKDRHSLDGIEAVEQADVLVVSVRRRTLPQAQLELVRRYVAAGKPVIGIRTANHAFSLRNQEAPQGRAVWPEWDKQVFGGNYTNHYGNSLKVTVQVQPVPAAAKNLLRGIPQQSFTAGGSLYRVAPLAKSATVYLTGSVQGHPPEPVAWTYRRTDGGWSFYTSLGHVDDFHGKVLPQLLVNAISRATR